MRGHEDSGVILKFFKNDINIKIYYYDKKF